MKKFIKTPFNNEIKWFNALTRGQRTRILYAALSASVFLCVTSSSILVETLLLINAFVAARLCRKIDVNSLGD